MIFVGEETDVAIAKEMFHIILKRLNRLVREYFGPGYKKRHRSFCLGFSCGLMHKLTLEEQHKTHSDKNEQTYALVVASKSTSIMAFIKQRHPKMKPAKETKLNDIDEVAYRMGTIHGTKTDTGTKRRLK